MSIISDIFKGGLEGVISPITSMVTAIFTKKEDASVEKFKVDGKVDIALVQAHVELEKSKNDLRHTRAFQILLLAFGLPLAFYYGKIHTWDAALHLGVTDAIKGDVALWDKILITFLFGASALANWNRKT